MNLDGLEIKVGLTSGKKVHVLLTRSLTASCLGFVPCRAEVGDHCAKLLLVVGSVAQKLVLQELVGRPSLLRVLDQTLVYKVLEN